MRIILFVFLILHTAVLCQGINFFGEDITFRLDNGYFIVDGIYWFNNESNKPVEKIIYYPFPTDSAAGEVESISIYNLSEQQEEIALDISDKGLRYLLMIAAKDTAIYRIGYRQKVSNNCVKYILTSTAYWSRPLDWVNYKLITDNKTEIKKFSYEPDRLYQIDNEKIFFWERKDFLPEFDFVICIKR